MDSNNIELIIAIKKDSFKSFVNLLIIAAGIIICYFLYLAAGIIMGLVSPFIMIGVFFIVRWLVVQSRIEYEYTLSSGVLNIDRIINQSKRKPVIKVQVSSISQFGKLSDKAAQQASKSAVKVVTCGNTDEDDGAYYFTCNYEKNGLYMFIFNPNDRMLNVISKYNKGIKSQRI